MTKLTTHHLIKNSPITDDSKFSTSDNKSTIHPINTEYKPYSINPAGAPNTINFSIRSGQTTSNIHQADSGYDTTGRTSKFQANRTNRVTSHTNSVDRAISQPANSKANYPLNNASIPPSNMDTKSNYKTNEALLSHDTNNIRSSTQGIGNTDHQYNYGNITSTAKERHSKATRTHNNSIAMPLAHGSKNYPQQRLTGK